MAPFLKLAPTATNAGLDAANRKAFLEAQAAARDIPRLSYTKALKDVY